MLKYKNKKTGIVVDAMQVNENTVDEIANWTQSQIVEERDALTGEASEGLNIKTPDGKRRASRGAYVIKHGDYFYVSGGAKFEAKYEVV